MAKLNLDLTANKTLGTKTVLPSGVYSVQIESAELKETNAKTGHYLEVGFKVLDGEHKESVVINRFNTHNNNPDAERIGRDQLKTMITMAGYANPNMLADSDEILGLRLRLNLLKKETEYVQDGETKKGSENEFKGYFKFSGEVSESNTEPVKESAPAATKSNPWD